MPTTVLARAAAGETAAFAEVYDATAARVYGLALRIVRNESLAEEVAKESYAEIWRTAHTFDPQRGSAMSWVLTITHALAVNRVRSVPARTDREQSPRQDTTFAQAHAPSGARQVHDALAGLPAVQRHVLELAYFGSRTHSEVATRLGLPPDTAATRIRDGLIQLRGVLMAQ